MRKKLPLIIKGTSAVSICLLLYLWMMIGRANRWWAFAFAAYLAFLGIWLIISSRRQAGSTGQGGAQLSRRFALIRKAQSRKDQDQG
jgi:hypothetical protein